MKLDPYLVFKGAAEEALSHYCNALGWEHTEIKRYKDSPMEHNPSQANWVIHCELTYKGKIQAMVCDGPSEGSSNQIQLSLNFDSLDPLEKAFNKLSEGGKITRPLQKEFWNATFGQLIDRFGIHWMMNCNHQS